MVHPHDVLVVPHQSKITTQKNLLRTRWRRRLRQEPEPSVVRVDHSTKRLATNAEVRVLEAVLREVLLVRAHASELRELVQIIDQ